MDSARSFSRLKIVIVYIIYFIGTYGISLQTASLSSDSWITVSFFCFLQIFFWLILISQYRLTSHFNRCRFFTIIFYAFNIQFFFLFILFFKFKKKTYNYSLIAILVYLNINIYFHLIISLYILFLLIQPLKFS